MSSPAPDEEARLADCRCNPAGNCFTDCKARAGRRAGRGRALQKRYSPEPIPGAWDERLETVGQRLREKYTRALRTACQTAVAPLSRRDDRQQLARILCEEHLLVPQEEYRTALRQIARQTNSSFARVAQCVRLLTGTVRATLQADPEFRELQRTLRVAPACAETPIDTAFERKLAKTCAQELLRRYHAAPQAQQARILHAVFEVSGQDVGDLLLSTLSRLRPAERERLVSLTAAEGIDESFTDRPRRLPNGPRIARP